MRHSFYSVGLCAATFCTALFAVPSAHAQTVFYSDLATFNANTAANRYTETFTTGVAPQSANSYSVAGNGYSYTVTTSQNRVFESGTDPINPNIIGTNNPNENLIFTFNSGNVTAIGGNFFTTYSNNGFYGGPVTLTLDNGTTSTYSPATQSTFGGFTTTASITSLTLSIPTTPTGLYASADNIVVGTRITPAAAPEPGSLVLMGMGLIGGVGSFGITRRRKSAKTAA